MTHVGVSWPGGLNQNFLSLEGVEKRRDQMNPYILIAFDLHRTWSICIRIFSNDTTCWNLVKMARFTYLGKEENSANWAVKNMPVPREQISVEKRNQSCRFVRNLSSGKHGHLFLPTPPLKLYRSLSPQLKMMTRVQKKSGKGLEATTKKLLRVSFHGRHFIEE